MKVVTEPKIHLVGRQEVDAAALAAFLEANDAGAWSTDTEVGAETLVEVAGRTCYMSFARPRPGGNAAYVGHILEVGHGSVLEHAAFNLIIEGVSRSFTHELVRHRAGWGFSQLSQRFVDEAGCEFVVPPALLSEVEDYERFSTDYFDPSGRTTRLALDAGAAWVGAMETCRRAYQALSDYLFAREARGAYAAAVSGEARRPGR